MLALAAAAAGAAAGATVMAVQAGPEPPPEPGRVDTRPMLDASVSIKTVSHVHIDSLGDSVWETGAGSGFLVNAENCEVWTNHHVIESAAIIEVFPRGWTASAGIPARLLNSTPRGDFAVLHMERCDGMVAAKLGDSDALRPGDDTFAVGNPLGNNPDSVSRGIISHTERFVGENTIAYLQTDAPINLGNSGGALFNRAGEVIGMNTAIASRGAGGSIGIGYALPVNLARRIAEDLHRGSPGWGDAGLEGHLSALSPDEAAIFGVPAGSAGVIVTATPEDGPARDVLREHDVIYRIGSLDVVSVEQARRIIEDHRPGEVLGVELVRAGAPRTVELTLANGFEAGELPRADTYTGYLGMTLEIWAGRDGEEGRFTTPVITHVQSLGPAHRALIASSQRAYAARGPFLQEYRLDVRTITGVVLDGHYHAVTTPAELHELAAAAYRESRPLLLEIQHWVRENPANPETALAHRDTGWFKVTPHPSEEVVALADLD